MALITKPFLCVREAFSIVLSLLKTQSQKQGVWASRSRWAVLGSTLTCDCCVCCVLLRPITFRVITWLSIWPWQNIVVLQPRIGPKVPGFGRTFISAVVLERARLWVDPLKQNRVVLLKLQRPLFRQIWPTQASSRWLPSQNALSPRVMNVL